MLRPTPLVLLIVFCCACNSGSSSNSGSTSPATPTFTAFDAPGALTQPPGYSCGTVPTDINANSIIVGNSTVGGFIRSPDGTFTTVVLPSGAQTSVMAINSLGTVVGSSLSPVFSAFTRTSSGQYSVLYVPSYDLPGLGNTPVAYLKTTSINDSGQFVGYFLDKNAVSHAFLATTNGLQVVFGLTFSPPYEFATSASHININGAVVGSSAEADGGPVGFSYNANGHQGVVTLRGPAVDINADGNIIGTTTDTSTHSYLLTPDGNYTEFDPPGTGAGGSNPVRINSPGQIVGNFLDNVSVSHGYLRNVDGTFTIIDEPETVSASGYGTFITGINDSGTIVGYFYDYRTDCHGFVLK